MESKHYLLKCWKYVYYFNTCILAFPSRRDTIKLAIPRHVNLLQMQGNFLRRGVANRPQDLTSHRLRRIPARYRKVAELAGPPLLSRGILVLRVYTKHKTNITVHCCSENTNNRSSNNNLITKAVCRK